MWFQNDAAKPWPERKKERMKEGSEENYNGYWFITPKNYGAFYELIIIMAKMNCLKELWTGPCYIIMMPGYIA